MAFAPVEIFIQEGLEESPPAVRARAAAPQARACAFGDLTALAARLEGLTVEEAKKRLIVARRAGGFVKEFPAGPGIRKSGWRYFVPAIGCPADCRYCFLQSYANTAVPLVFAQTDGMLAEIRTVALALGGGYFYGGELCDDLMLERFAGVAAPLVELFRAMPSAVLELRTKSDDVAPLLALEAPPANVVISWTMSPREIADAFEPGAAALEDRIDAARRLQQAGWLVGLRLDPIVLLEGWRDAYRNLVGALARALDPAGVESVHLGALRFTPGLKTFACERFGRGEPFCGEFVLGTDGKYRYPRPLRAAAYAMIAKELLAWDARLGIRLCMETAEVEDDFRTMTLALDAGA